MQDDTNVVVPTTEGEAPVEETAEVAEGEEVATAETVAETPAV